MTDKERERIIALIESLRKTVKSPFIARMKLADVTGGVLEGRTQANRDSEGTGIDGLFYIGRKAVYPTEAVIDRLKREAGVM